MAESPTAGSYFDGRNITPEYYADFAIPAYLLEILPGTKSAPILDIGCGYGQLLAALKSRGYTSLAGIDVLGSAVDHCQRAGLSVSRIESIAEYAKHSSAKFDFIVMSHVLEHIEKHAIIETLEHIRKYLLSESGKFVVMVPNAQAETGAYWAFEDFTHTTAFTAGSLFYVLKSAGFQHVSFLDPKGTSGRGLFRRLKVGFFLQIFLLKKRFWHSITGAVYHRQSPQIFTWEVKALATNTADASRRP